MKNELGPLLARASVEEIETQHDAVGRLVKILAEASDADGSTPAATQVEDARSALYELLSSPRLAVVSKACHGERGRFMYYVVQFSVFWLAVDPRSSVRNCQFLNGLVAGYHTSSQQSERSESCHVALRDTFPAAGIAYSGSKCR